MEKYFFPIYEVVAPLQDFGAKGTRNTFVGVAVPSEEADDFKGLYRVSDSTEFKEWPSLRLPSDVKAFRHFQTLSTPTDRIHRFARGDNAFGWCDRAGEAFETKHYEQAIAYYKAYFTMRPNDVNAIYKMALAMEQIGDVDSAMKTCLKTFKQNPQDRSFSYNLDRLISRAHPQQRIETWAKIAEENPKASAARHYLGMARSDAGDIDGAITAFRQATELDPSQSFDFEALGRAMIKKQDFAGSIVPLRRAIELNQKATYLRFDLINSLIATDNINAAEEEVRICQEKGLAVQPNVLEILRQRKAAKG
jgi:tetratricopeptide (TPR) repeat protein